MLNSVWVSVTALSEWGARFIINDDNVALVVRTSGVEGASEETMDLTSEMTESVAWSLLVMARS